MPGRLAAFRQNLHDPSRDPGRFHQASESISAIGRPRVNPDTARTMDPASIP
jgi:hypothetical protein